MSTKIVDLAGGPVNLAADGDLVNMADPDGPRPVLVQNIGTARAYYRESATAPATTDYGHVLKSCEAFELVLFASMAGAWIWSRSTGKVAVTPRGL